MTLSVLTHIRIIRQVLRLELVVGKLKVGFLVKNGHKAVAAQFGEKWDVGKFHELTLLASRVVPFVSSPLRAMLFQIA